MIEAQLVRGVGNKMPAVHLAGNRVVIGHRIIQRCLICGERLIDVPDVQNIAAPEGMGVHISTWQVGAWVMVDGNMSTLVSMSESPDFTEDEIPEHCCVELIER